MQVASILSWLAPKYAHPPVRIWHCRSRSAVEKMHFFRAVCAISATSERGPVARSLSSCVLSSLSCDTPALIDEFLHVRGVEPQGAASRTHFHGWQIRLSLT